MRCDGQDKSGEMARKSEPVVPPKVPELQFKQISAPRSVGVYIGWHWSLDLRIYSTVGQRSGPVFGGYGSFGNGVFVFGASAGANLTGGAGGGANFTKTTNPHQFSLVVGSLFTTPLDNALSFARGLVCHQ